jgi:hypothetical protein
LELRKLKNLILKDQYGNSDPKIKSILYHNNPEKYRRSIDEQFKKRKERCDKAFKQLLTGN